MDHAGGGLSSTSYQMSGPQSSPPDIQAMWQLYDVSCQSPVVTRANAACMWSSRHSHVGVSPLRLQ
eukprot:scaffold198746_cov35-Tisochrysis_lutea.AAC.1